MNGQKKILKIFRSAVAGFGAGSNRLAPYAVAAAILILAALLACEQFTPVDLQKRSLFLMPPTNVSVRLGNGYVVLSWDFPDTVTVKSFRIYRRAQSEEDFTRVGETTNKSYRDDYLANGSRYEYEVAAVSDAGVEGQHSKPIVAIPAIYSIQINDGALYTNKRQVLIKVTAPANTTLMMFANDSSFDGAVWEAFSDTKLWNLSYGDGEKTVYAKFRNLDDQEIDRPVTAKITLDQVAIISFIEENSNGRVLDALDTLHIRLGAFETNGRATASIVD
ncbi:MAG: fibronectin type III domain-containing protein, partial [Calditrichaeota bacterium]